MSLICKYSREWTVATTHEFAVVDTSLQHRDRTLHTGVVHTSGSARLLLLSMSAILCRVISSKDWHSVHYTPWNTSIKYKWSTYLRITSLHCITQLWCSFTYQGAHTGVNRQDTFANTWCEPRPIRHASPVCKCCAVISVTGTRKSWQPRWSSGPRDIGIDNGVGKPHRNNFSWTH